MDYLPDDLPETVRRDTRIFFYNYESYWKRDAIDTQLWKLGNRLLEHIRSELHQAEEVSNVSTLSNNQFMTR